MRMDMKMIDFVASALLPGKYSYRLQFAHTNAHQTNEYVPLNVIQGASSGPTLLILAAVHGDEYEGVQTVIQLFRQLQPEDLRGTLLLVPITNVDSYIAGTRTSGVDGGNLARAFPGKEDGTYTERLAWHLREVLLKQSDFLLDLHSGGTFYAMPPMIGYYHQPNQPFAHQSWEAAHCFGMPVIWGHETIGPGRTVSSATDLGIPWLYTEGYGGRRILAAEQQLYREGALRLMKYMNMLIHPEQWLPYPMSPMRYHILGDGNLDQAEVAAEDGFFIPEVSLLDEVSQGAIIGRLFDWEGIELQTIYANTSGVVMMLRAIPVVKKADHIYLLANKYG